MMCILRTFLLCKGEGGEREREREREGEGERGRERHDSNMHRQQIRELRNGMKMQEQLK